ncbi:putative phage abortive infection protein [Pseudomonas soli]|uniref:putative phage abortive infection protein n=1 Tax=Pseudomonas soli TaxID=1306993 RepID=UPI003DA7F135
MEDKVEAKEDRDQIGISIVAIIICAVAAVTAVSVAIISRFFLNSDLPIVTMRSLGSAQYWGQIGDFFGGILNPLLSFLALVAVATSLRVQSLELRAARKESAAAQELLDKQTGVLKQQHKVIERQSFETTFFGMIQLLEQTIKSLALRFGPQPDTGRMAFAALANRFHVDRVDCSAVRPESYDLHVDSFVEGFLRAASSDAGHYFRILEEIFSYIDSYGESQILGSVLVRAWPFYMRDDKQRLRDRYARILAATLSNSELECIYCYCLSKEGANLKLYVEKYGTFANLAERHNREHPMFSERFAESAFALRSSN